jgi:hypothetical protein
LAQLSWGSRSTLEAEHLYQLRQQHRIWRNSVRNQDQLQKPNICTSCASNTSFGATQLGIKINFRSRTSVLAAPATQDLAQLGWVSRLTSETEHFYNAAPEG